MTRRLVWPVVFAVGAVVGVVAAWLNTAELRAVLADMGERPVPPARRVGLALYDDWEDILFVPYDWEEGR